MCKRFFVNPKNIETVVVRICLLSGFPVKTDAYASVEIKNIAGGAIIALSGGSNEAPFLKAEKHGKIPVITAKRSRIDQVIDTAPHIASQFKEVLEDFGVLFKGERKRTWIESLNLLHNNLKKFDKIQGHVLSILEKNKKNLNRIFGDETGFIQDFFKNGSEAMCAVKKIAEQIERSPARFLHQDPSKGTVLR